MVAQFLWILWVPLIHEVTSSRNYKYLIFIPYFINMNAQNYVPMNL